MPSNDVIALVLAAGRGRRFGNDKRLAGLPGRGTLLAATLATLRPHFADIRVVLRNEDDPAHLGIATSITTLAAKRADQGMGESLAAGIRALSADSQAHSVAVMLGDMPWLSEHLFSLLCSRASDRTIVRPLYRGKGGHPVLFGRRFWGSLEQLTGDEGARSVVRQYRDACIEIEVQDPGVVRDVDRPADLVWAGCSGR
ncbi:nucleotidyltransferase family protein [Halomonas ramblicola]|uniref:nucleotidyltransferase family protein n=1 Tax=Halomonas ramblicola TaxID=747349 RepID=UPI0025B4F56A|nr:nucleotidyltransferase family protein [Halomonas ramblicola]MDN3523492.1 nucleotidyltransferase family protein [Halomonas ramblicola]